MHEQTRPANKLRSPQVRGPKTRSALTTPAVVFWTLSVVVLVALLRERHANVALVFASLEVDLPGLTLVALEASSFVSQVTGLSVVAAVLGVTLLPFFLGARGKTAAKAYLALAVLGMLAVAGTWLALKRPLNVLHDKLETYTAPPGR